MSQFSSTPPSSPRSPLIGLFAGLIIGAVVVLAGLWILKGGPGLSEGSPLAPRTLEGADDPNSGALDPSAQDTGIPTNEPATRWIKFTWTAVPVSDSHGPAYVDGSVATGYAHTPTGALMAAGRYLVTVHVPEDWEYVVEKNVMPGVRRDLLLEKRKAAQHKRWLNLCGEGGTDPQSSVCATPDAWYLNEPEDGEACKISGFSFENYTDEKAVINIGCIRPSLNTLTRITVTVIWVEEERVWKLEPAPDGQVVLNPTRVTNLDDMVPWKQDTDE